MTLLISPVYSAIKQMRDYMKLTTSVVFAFFALLLTSPVFAACATDITGYSKEFKVVIFQDCGIRSEIVVSKLDKKNDDYTIPYQSAFLDTECSFAYEEKKMICRRSGKTILSGTQFNLTYDDVPNCPGESASLRYTCIKGCSKQVPKYLSVAGYEC
jgi:hypothetical protein